MKIKTPEKCCFVMPLRKGLLCFGYFKLVLSLLAQISCYVEEGFYLSLVVIISVDIIFNVILIAAVHKNHPGLLLTHFLYGVLLLMFQIISLILILAGVRSAELIFGNVILLSCIWFLSPSVTLVVIFYVFNILFQAYLLLLVISEMKVKLNESVEIETVEEGATSKVTTLSV